MPASEAKPKRCYRKRTQPFHSCAPSRFDLFFVIDTNTRLWYYLGMSIKIRLEAPGLVMQAQLDDKALGEAIALIQKHRIEEAPPPVAEQPGPTANNRDKESSVREILAKHAPAEVLNLLKWETYPDKILILGACYEARGGGEGWKSADMEKVFAEAKETPPANFPRDISKAIKSGDIRTVTPRTYAISRTGWNRLGAALAKVGTT
jgi:hypothetical protein